MESQREVWGWHGALHGALSLCALAARRQWDKFEQAQNLWSYEFASAMIFNGLWWGIWGGLAGYGVANLMCRACTRLVQSR